MRRDNLNNDPLLLLRRRVDALEKAVPLQSSSVTRGRVRVASVDGLVVEGQERVTGILVVDGTLQMTGTQTVSGTLIVSGGQIINGTFTINGPTTINGATDVTGNLGLTGTMTVSGAGRVVVGNLTMDPGGAYGGKISAGGGGVLYLEAANVLASEYISADGLSIGALGATILGDLTVFGAKAFGIAHPNKPGVVLRHAATESPVSGIEYWGEATLDDQGDAVVELPAYFDELAKPAGRIVLVTGRGFAADWSDIDTNTFTVTGTPGGRFSWLVKAERFGGDFDLEQPMPATTQED